MITDLISKKKKINQIITELFVREKLLFLSHSLILQNQGMFD